MNCGGETPCRPDPLPRCCLALTVLDVTMTAAEEPEPELFD